MRLASLAHGQETAGETGRDCIEARCVALILSTDPLIYCSPALFWRQSRQNRGDWQNLEREVQPYTAAFLHGPELHIRRIGEIMQQTA